MKKKKERKDGRIQIFERRLFVEIEIHVKLHMCVCVYSIQTCLSCVVDIYLDLFSFVFNIECSSNILIVISQGCMFSNSAYGILP